MPDKSLKKWAAILLPLFALGGGGSAIGLDLRGADRHANNEEYISQVSIEFLEMELKYSQMLAELSERVAKLEGSHEK